MQLRCIFIRRRSGGLSSTASELSGSGICVLILCIEYFEKVIVYVIPKLKSRRNFLCYLNKYANYVSFIINQICAVNQHTLS